MKARKIEIGELRPFGQNNQRMRALHRVILVHCITELRAFREYCPAIMHGCGIKDRDAAAFRQYLADYRYCGRLANIIRAMLKGKTKNSDVLVLQRPQGST